VSYYRLTAYETYGIGSQVIITRSIAHRMLSAFSVADYPQSKER